MHHKEFHLKVGSHRVESFWVPPHLQYLVLLHYPCEIQKCYGIFMLNVTINRAYVSLKFNVRSYLTCHKNIALMILLKYTIRYDTIGLVCI